MRFYGQGKSTVSAVAPQHNFTVNDVAKVFYTKTYLYLRRDHTEWLLCKDSTFAGRSGRVCSVYMYVNGSLLVVQRQQKGNEYDEQLVRVRRIPLVSALILRERS